MRASKIESLLNLHWRPLQSAQTLQRPSDFLSGVRFHCLAFQTMHMRHFCPTLIRPVVSRACRKSMSKRDTSVGLNQP